MTWIFIAEFSAKFNHYWFIINGKNSFSMQKHCVEGRTKNSKNPVAYRSIFYSWNKQLTKTKANFETMVSAFELHEVTFVEVNFGFNNKLAF